MDKRILAFTVTRASTPQRAALLQHTITQARATAGYPFDWKLITSGASKEGHAVASAAHLAGQVQEHHHYQLNVGQHVAWNEAYRYAKSKGYSYFLRLDDDCEFLTKRWLKKMLQATYTFEDKFIVSPSIRGLNHPPLRSQLCTVKDTPVEFLAEAIGGICRLHPMELIKDFYADVRKPLGSGDATGMADYCKVRMIPMVWLKHVRVKHAKTTSGQEAADPEHFALHGIFQHIPFIPCYEECRNE